MKCDACGCLMEPDEGCEFIEEQDFRYHLSKTKQKTRIHLIYCSTCADQRKEDIFNKE